LLRTISTLPVLKHCYKLPLATGAMK